jgi:hypothetical protein
LLTPGIYNLNDTIKVTRAKTVVLGLGFATLAANNIVIQCHPGQFACPCWLNLLGFAASAASNALRRWYA